MLMVGTGKGAFIFTSNDGRKNWKVTGPHFEGESVYYMSYDARNKILLAGSNSYQWGPSIVRSFDAGKTWKRSKSQPKYPKGSDVTIKNIWNIMPGAEDEPDVVYCGVDPAVLFRSNDKGESWVINKSLLNHETRDKWVPGFGGLCLHSILIDPNDPRKQHIAISAVGTLFSRDGGLSWRFQNKNVRADFLPNKYPNFGQCVHKIVRHPDRPSVIYQQNHCGQYRSDNNGEDWVDIQNNLPSEFGFPIAVDANDPKRIYTIPLGTPARFSPKGHFAVWMSENEGKRWTAMDNGFPKPPAYFTVLRDGMTSDKEDPCGVYLGTTTGHLYYSRNQGKNWTRITDSLPPILSVAVSAA
jgi:photosystem II stability/assembly factor-like uncharacterized protein